MEHSVYRVTWLHVDNTDDFDHLEDAVAFGREIQDNGMGRVKAISLMEIEDGYGHVEAIAVDSWRLADAEIELMEFDEKGVA